MAFPYNVSWIDHTNGFPKLFPAERKVILKEKYDFCSFIIAELITIWNFKENLKMQSV